MTTTSKKQFNLKIIFYILSSCFTVVTMFYPISCKKQKENASQESVEILRNEHERLKQSVQVKLHLLGKRNDSLQLQLRQVHQKLTDQKVKHTLKRAQLQLLIGTQKDSVNIPCDSVRQVTQQYIDSDQTQDSLYEANIEELEEVIQVKDSTIDVLQTGLDQSQQLTEKSLWQQQTLQEQLLTKDKQLKRNRLLNKIAISVGLVITGAAAVLLIH
jgi:hypothetical protein